MEAELTSGDGVDLDVSVSAELTETGIKASAKSRLVSAFDRLGGNLLDWIGSPLDGWNERRKARIAGEKALIEAVARYGAEKLGNDDEFASRLLTAQFGKLAREQLNKDAVLGVALEDLRQDPVKDSSPDGPNTLTEEFLDRVGSYASQANTDVLREKWGRVLAAEIREPGTFSNKVLRVVDELDAETAQLFENVCVHQLSGAIPKCLVGSLTFLQRVRLTTAGLIVEPGLGQHRNFEELVGSDGRRVWAVLQRDGGVSFPAEATIPPNNGQQEVPLSLSNGRPVVPVYVLTDVGSAISTILPDRAQEALRAYAEKLRTVLPSTEISILARDGTMLNVVDVLPVTSTDDQPSHEKS